MPETAVSLQASAAGEVPRPGLTWRDRLAVKVQSWCARLAGPLTIPAVVLFMRFFRRWRIRDHSGVRRRYLAALKEQDGPVLIAANHLTYYDSVVITWALAPVWWLVVHNSKLPWNVPERKNFASSLSTRTMAYLYKCLPITRGGDRAEATLVLNKLGSLLRRGEPVFMFPEGRRSRSGRVDRSNAAHGVGRLVKSVPGIKVLCVYLRGDHQCEPSVWAARGEIFDIDFSWLQPTTERRGLRGSMELTHQILERLEAMEEAHFDGR